MLIPIKTNYSGCKFRSRLEARYAVFFDSLGISWEYEPEGFVLSNGMCYLPDFWLPTFNGGMWVEVKAKPLTKKEKLKCYLLCQESKYSVWMAVGMPTFRCYEVYYWMDEPPYVVHGDGIPNADQAEHENRMFGMSAYGEPGELIRPEYIKLMGNKLPFAIKEARSARFEFDD